MEFPNEVELHRVTHDLTMEYIKRNYKPRSSSSNLIPGTYSPVDIPERLANEYLSLYPKILAQLRTG